MSVDEPRLKVARSLTLSVLQAAVRDAAGPMLGVGALASSLSVWGTVTVGLAAAVTACASAIILFFAGRAMAREALSVWDRIAELNARISKIDDARGATAGQVIELFKKSSAWPPSSPTPEVRARSEIIRELIKTRASQLDSLDSRIALRSVPSSLDALRQLERDLVAYEAAVEREAQDGELIAKLVREMLGGTS